MNRIERNLRDQLDSALAEIDQLQQRDIRASTVSKALPKVLWAEADGDAVLIHNGNPTLEVMVDTGLLTKFHRDDVVVALVKERDSLLERSASLERELAAVRLSRNKVMSSGQELRKDRDSVRTELGALGLEHSLAVAEGKDRITKAYTERTTAAVALAKTVLHTGNGAGGGQGR